MKDLSNENIIHVKKDENEYIQFKKLLEYNDMVKHAYGIGIDKNYRTSDEKSYNKAIENYKQLCTAIKVNYIDCVKPCQKHTKNIKKDSKNGNGHK